MKNKARLTERLTNRPANRLTKITGSVSPAYGHGSGECPNIAYVSSYTPRRCGIATFTSDLSTAVRKLTGKPYRVIALDDISSGYRYGKDVCFRIRQNEASDYKRAADYVNRSGVGVVSIQHEFGLFGGQAGERLRHFLENLSKPVVSTMHTVIKNPSPEYYRSTMDLVWYSDIIVVMSNVAAQILGEVYNAPREKIEIIHHGVPDVPFKDSNQYKQRFNLEGRTVVLTFGLLSPNKGIENVLDALPPVVKKYPNLTYVILGTIHPTVRRTFGNDYRVLLEGKVSDLGLKKNVVFLPRFVERKRLYEYIMAADIYVTPYLQREQCVSGTLSYALGMGKAIISTPYWYAQEVLSEERGIIVPFGDTKALTAAFMNLMDNPDLYNRIRANAYQFTRGMVWKEVAARYVEVFQKVADRGRSRACSETGRTGSLSRDIAARDKTNPPLRALR